MRDLNEGKNGREESPASQADPARKPYQAPTLTVYGDLSRLVGAKGGTRGDGTGKPKTKV